MLWWTLGLLVVFVVGLLCGGALCAAGVHLERERRDHALEAERRVHVQQLEALAAAQDELVRRLDAFAQGIVEQMTRIAHRQAGGVYVFDGDAPQH